MAAKSPALIDRISSFIRRYVSLPVHELEVVSHYVLHTHQFSERCQAPYVTPYLFVNSAQKGSGKTLLGNDIMGCLCRNFEAVNNVTPATLFRLTEMRATIAIDEVDMLFGGSRSDDDLVSVLNTGYRKGGTVPRVDPKAEDGVRRYSTFSPKILIGIDSGTMRDTTRDRCIPVSMQRATDDERKTVQPFYHYKVEDEIAELWDDIHAWSLDNTVGMREYDPTPIESLSPRQWEVCVSLIQVAKVTGREKQMREALTAIFQSAVFHEDSPDVDMLVTIRDMFEENGDKLRSSEILSRLQLDERFRHWSGKQLAVKLAPYGIKIKPVRFSGEAGGVQRGILRGDCLDTFTRYL